jgi:hypothetical protein
VSATVVESALDGFAGSMLAYVQATAGFAEIAVDALGATGAVAVYGVLDAQDSGLDVFGGFVRTRDILPVNTLVVEATARFVDLAAAGGVMTVEADRDRRLTVSR